MPMPVVALPLAALRTTRQRLISGNHPSRFARWYQRTARGRVPNVTVTQQETEPLYSPIVLPDPGPAPQLSKVRRQKDAIRSAKPFSEFLTDNFKRQHDYLRISVTERCNLRCLYCMPEEGIQLSPPARLLTSPEIFYLSSLFVSEGVRKIRLTGGEPTVRRDIVPLMQSIGTLRRKGLQELCITTNGISLYRKLDSMVDAGLTGVNLSLDTLDPFQFQIMTRRKGFDAVMKSIDRILEMNQRGAGIKLKVNCVVMRGLNEREIVPFVEMGREKDIEVRFIEYMPFGGNKWSQGKMVTYQEMLNIIREKYPRLRKVQGHKNDTSKTWEIPGFIGKVGFITSMTNDFCGTCNRLRITSDGNLKVCLHGNTEVSLRDILRKGNDDKPIDEEAFETLKEIEINRQQGLLGDETPLGWGERETELLEVIGAAVKRKKEKHAGMGELENMKNRPMILIDDLVQQPCVHQPSWFSPPKALSSPSSRILPSTHLLPTQSNVIFSSTRYFSTTARQNNTDLLQGPCKGGRVRKTNLNKGPILFPRDIHARYSVSSQAWKYARSAKSSIPAYENQLQRKVEVLARQLQKSGRSTAQLELLAADELRRKIYPRKSLIRRSSRGIDPVTRGDASPRIRLVRTHRARAQVRRRLPPGRTDAYLEDGSDTATSAPSLPHLTTTGAAHMVSVTSKPNTVRTAIATGCIIFSNPTPVKLIRSNTLEKGDVLAVSRIAGINAAKKTPDWIPLCHPVNLTHVGVDVFVEGHSSSDESAPYPNGAVVIEAKVTCVGPTGVEMEALTAVLGATATVYDMCKSVDKCMTIRDVRVVFKDGGRHGIWREEGWVSKNNGVDGEN